MPDRLVRLAALADLHCDRTCQGALHSLFDAAAERADVMLLCGDLTHHGTAEEAALLARELAGVRVPVVAVLGNHDYQAGTIDDLTRVLADAGVRVLDGDAVELNGVGFAGVKGFAGGFGPRILESWGEDIIKRFVHEAVEEGLKLESALSRIASPVRVVLMHYAPIAATVAGEPPEIYAFLGCSRLEEPLNRYHVAVAFHGHAHHGTAEGRTSGGVPVFNVSISLLRQTWPDALPVRFVEVRVPAPAPSPAPAHSPAGATPSPTPPMAGTTLPPAVSTTPPERAPGTTSEGGHPGAAATPPDHEATRPAVHVLPPFAVESPAPQPTEALRGAQGNGDGVPGLVPTTAPPPAP